jgi:hypothetical protein
MSYASRFLTAHGQACVINRNYTLTMMPWSLYPVSFVSMKRSSKSTSNPGIRDAMWEGLILAASNLASGEILTVGSDKYLIQSVTSDAASGELAWFGVKTNVVLTHKRYTEGLDENNNIVQTWATITADVAAFGQIVTAELRQYDPGLLDSCRYIFQVPSSIGLLELDRLVMNGKNYQVEAIDDVGLAGVWRIQCSVDTRI